ncbi:osmoprotectant transport system permease protein, partial [Aureimonas jatrophae]
RLSLVTGLGLGAIGSTVGSRTLGEVIVAGLLSGNAAFVLEGAVLIGLLALVVSGAMEGVGRWVGAGRR